MKKAISLFSLMMLLSITTLSFAQLRYGVRAGLNLGKIIMAEDLGGATQKMHTSFHVGGITEYGLSESFSLESGVLLSAKGTKLEYSESDQGITVTGTSSISPLYLEIPVKALYKVNLGSTKLHLFAGPYFGIGVAGKYKTEMKATGLPSGVTLSSLGFENESANIVFGSDVDSDLKTLDFGLNFGAGVEINNLLLSLQYDLGLSNLDPLGSSEFEMKNRVIGISVGYMFGVE
jgi:hypothetical protein